VQEYDAGKTKHSLQKDANLIKQKYMTKETAEQNTNNQLKSSNEKEQTEELQSKPRRGQFCRDLERPSVYQEKSMPWLCSSGLKGEMKSLIIVDQDQVLYTCYHQRNIMKQSTDSKCKMCCKKNT
jgi:hypothetical protein